MGNHMAYGAAWVGVISNVVSKGAGYLISALHGTAWGYRLPVLQYDSVPDGGFAK